MFTQIEYMHIQVYVEGFSKGLKAFFFNLVI